MYLHTKPLRVRRKAKRIRTVVIFAPTPERARYLCRVQHPKACIVGSYSAFAGEHIIRVTGSLN